MPEMFSHICFRNFDAASIKKNLSLASVRPSEERPEIRSEANLVGFPRRNALYRLNGKRVDYASLTYTPPRPFYPEAKRQRADAKNSRYDPHETVVPSDLKIVDEPLLYIGSLPTHFGHFLLDGMSRMYSLHRRAGRRIMITSHVGIRKVLGLRFVRQILDLLDLKEADLYTIDRPSVFKAVEIPFPSIHYSYEMYHTQKHPHRALAERCGAGSEFKKPIYLTRSALGPESRKVHGEAELEEALARKGFTVISPETMSMADQARMFGQSPLIVGTFGSVFHNCLFELEESIGSRVTLGGTDVNGRYLMVDEIMSRQHKAYYLNVQTSARDNRRGVAWEMDWRLALQLMREEGFV